MRVAGMTLVVGAAATFSLMPQHRWEFVANFPAMALIRGGVAHLVSTIFGAVYAVGALAKSQGGLLTTVDSGSTLTLFICASVVAVSAIIEPLCRVHNHSGAVLKQRLKDSEERFRLLVDGIHDHAIFTLDPEGHVVNWNAAAEHVTGWREQEILGSRFAMFFPEDALVRGDPGRHLLTAAKDGKFSEQAPRIRKDGSRFWADVEMTTLYDAKGKVRGFAKVLRDVSDRVRANRDADESASRLASIIESAMDAFITTDAEQRIVVFNKAAEKMFGYATADIVGQKLDILIPERLRRDHTKYVANFAAPGVKSRAMAGSGALSGRRSDGEEFPIEASISQASIDGKKFYSVILRDITARKQAEERQALLVRELAHRVKNTLAVAQAIAAHTHRYAPGDKFQDAFQGRLAALSAAHELLLDNDRGGAMLNEILSFVFAPCGAESGARQWTLDGPKIWLAPNEAVTLTLAFHELTTNALKFGALSDSHGRIAIRWTLDMTDGAPVLAIEWLERDGPPVDPPQRRSFGSRLLPQTIANELRGQTEMAFPPTGAECRVRFPLSERVKVLA
jgi:PAS domain S-box-containing protein